MTIEEAYPLLKEAFTEYKQQRYFEKTSKSHAKRKYKEQTKIIENRVWQLFQSCPELNNYVPYEGEFFTSFFEQDFKKLIENLEIELSKSSSI